jgi:hypothetical protein
MPTRIYKPASDAIADNQGITIKIFILSYEAIELVMSKKVKQVLVEMMALVRHTRRQRSLNF